MVTPRVAGGLGHDRAVERRLPPRAARRRSPARGRATTPTSPTPGSAGWPRRSPARFFHDGAWSSFRRRHHGRPVDTALLPGWKFLGYLQDHDQIGNRAVGDRISATLSPGLLAVGATLVLTSPFTPMLFMGEEWGAGTPWQFFTSHPEPELGKATAEGRIGEFAEHGWDADVVPTRRTRRRSPARSWTGPSPTGSRTGGCWRCTGRCSRCAGRTPSWSTPTCRRWR